MPQEMNPESTMDEGDDTRFLDGVPGFEDDTDVETTPTEESGAATRPKEDTTPKEGAPTDQQQNTQQPSNDNGSTQPREQGAGLPPDLHRDAEGNIVDRDGNIVAAAGAERRHFERQALENINRVTTLANQLRDENTQLKQQIQNLQGLGATATQMGLSDDDASQAMRLYVSLRTDPVKVAQNLLTNLKAAGHNIEGLSPGIDAAALAQMIDEKLKPLTSRYEEADRNTEIEQQGKREAQEFFTQYPDAQVHEQAIANVMMANLDRTGKPMSPTEAWFQVYKYAVDNKFDLKQPLAPQIEARRSGGTQRANPTQDNASGVSQPPLAGFQSGSAAASQGGMVDPGSPPQDYVASPDTSIADIVRHAMKDAGMAY